MNIESLDRRFDECKDKINLMALVDQKLAFAIEFMKEALSNGRKARFRDFWRMKKICLDLFKSEIPKAKRAVFWSDYTALLSEAHALQKIIEEQTGFQAEQISLAIDSLEEEKKEGEIGLSQEDADLFETVDRTGLIARLYKMSLYYQTLREQALSYRKEILVLEIRISLKNKLLNRLSKICDKIFPKRKELLLDLTKAFSGIVTEYVETHFDLGEKQIKSRPPFFHLREKIKSFQLALRKLSISNESYQRIRTQLGECWDVISVAEKELKKNTLLKKQEKIKVGMVEDEKKKRVKQQEQERKEKLNEIVEKLDSLRTKAKRMKLENLIEQFDELRLAEVHFDSWDRPRILFEYKKQVLKYIVIDKKIRAGEEIEAELLTLYKEIKQLIERIKGTRAGCGLDIEFAFLLDELISEGKEIVVEIEGKF